MRTALWVAALALPAVADDLTRADLARAYLRFEEALAAHRPDDLTAASRGVDRITGALMAGDHATVLRILDDLTGSLTGVRPPGLRVRVSPRVLASGEVARLVVDRVGPAADGWVLRVRDDAGLLPWSSEAAPGGFDLPALPEGRYVVELADGATGAYPAAEFFVSKRPLAEVRLALEARLAALTSPENVRESLRARLDLLDADPPLDRAVHLLEDPLRLAGDLAEEIAVAEKGDDPYRRRPGELWRVASQGGTRVPLRVFAPAGLGDEPAPLVVALHGAGGDENLFFHGLGNGRLKALAEEHGFVVVTPLTYPLAASPRLFDAVLEAATGCHRIDASRIYLLGHSLGAMTAAQLAAQRPERFAAVVCIGGGGAAPEGARFLFVAGEQDPLFPPWRLRRVAEASRAAGARADLRAIPGVGHTLVVGEALPACVAWLLEQRREAR